MTHIQRSALIAKPAADLYALVDDIEAYPAFVPWCEAAEVHERTAEAVTASLTIARRGLRQQFTTRNRLSPPNEIGMALVDGPFSALDGRWQFEPLGDLGCKVTLTLDFELASGVAAAGFAAVFSEVSNRLVDAFCERALSV